MLENVSQPSADFMERLRRRDREAVSEIIKDYHNDLILGAKAQRLSDELADEVVAETWSVFFEKADQFEGRSHIRTYLFGIMLNKVRETRRKMGKLEPVDDPEKLLEANFNSDGLWAYEPSSPDQFIEAIEVQEALEDCMNELNENQKKVYYLKEVEGFENNEICNLIELTMTNLKVTLHRARNQVRRCVEGRIG